MLTKTSVKYRPGNYGDDRKWSDEYLPAVKRIVGPYLLSEAPFEVDGHATLNL